MIWLIAAYLALFTILSLKRIDWALMLMFFLLPSYLLRFQLVIPWTLLEWMILIVFAVWFFKEHKTVMANLRSKIRAPRAKIVQDYPFKWELIALLVISFIATGVAGFSNEALGIWKAYFFEPVLLFIVVFNVFGRYGICPPDKGGSRGVLSAGSNPPNPPYQGGSYAQWTGKIIWPLCLSALAVSLFAVWQKFTGQFIPNPLWAAEATRRVTSVFGYPNAVGLYVESIIFLALGYLFVIARSCATKQSRVGSKEGGAKSYQLDSNKPEIPACRQAGSLLLLPRNDKIKALVLVLTIIASLLSIIFAKSAGAALGVVAGAAVFALLAGKRSRWATIGILLFAAAGIVAYQPARQEAVKQLTLNDFSGQVRKLQWRETWTMLRADNRWLFGAGLANYKAALKPYHAEGFFYNKNDDPDFQRKIVLFDEKYKAQFWQPLEIFMYPHNILLNFWTELGFLGALLFAWIIGKYLFIGLRLALNRTAGGERFIAISLIAAMVAVVVHGLVDVPYFKNDLSALFWLLAAMMGIMTVNYCVADSGKK